MRLLLDTHAVLWWLADDPALGERARAAVADPRHEVFVSAVSLWEASIKRALGTLKVPDELPAVIEGSGFLPVTVTWTHAWVAGGLPAVHGDPFDRMLVAQAQVESLTVVTADERIAAYGVAVLDARS